MAKTVAVLVRERQEEALRVAVGLTLCDNRVEVCVLDRKVVRTAPAEAYLDALRESGVRPATTSAGDEGLELLTVEELAGRLLGCDHILPY